MVEQDDKAFDACFIDDDITRCEVVIQGVTFRLRGITVGEHARIQQMARAAPITRPDPSPDDVAAFASGIGKTPEAMTDEERRRAEQLSVSAISEATIDVWRLQYLTVGAALGCWSLFGDEGWSQDRPVNLESVVKLRREVVTHLYAQHASFFRPIAFDAEESGRGDSLGIQTSDSELVSSV